MTQEEKQLLLKDLCARLPYGVYVHHPDFEQVFCLEEISLGGYWRFSLASNRRRTLGFEFFEKEMKPYLRPMSSMTEEERKELQGLVGPIIYDEENNIIVGLECNTLEQFTLLENWLNAHHFDYRGLIERELALEASEGMYKTE